MPARPIEPHWLEGGGKMGQLIRAKDWSATPVGPLEQWPQSLRVAVGICLNSRFPMFIWWGPHLIHIYNDAYVPTLAGHHPGALGQSAPEVWQELWPVVGPQADAVMRRGEATWNQRVHLLMQRRSGYPEDTYFTWSYSPIPDDAGGVGGLFCVSIEETAYVSAERERDRLMAELEAARARLADVFKRSPAFMTILRGPEHVFELANDRYHQLVGHRELIGRPVREAFPEIEGQGYFEILDRVYATGEPFIGKDMKILLQRHPDQQPEECYIEFVYQPMRDADGKITGIFTHGIELTARNRAERREREAVAQRDRQARVFDAVLSAITDFAYSFDREGRFVFVNQPLLDLWGLTLEQAVGKDFFELHYPYELAAKLQAQIQQVFDTKNVLTDETPYTSPSGALGFYEYIFSPVIGASGMVEAVAGTTRDITGRKQAESAREQLLASERAARSDAERAGRMKDEFLATLSHELRTPLNAIIGWSQILRGGGSARPEDLDEGLQVIERNARAQAQIIEDLLDMSRIISGKVRLDVKQIDLFSVVRGGVDTLRPAAEAKDIRLYVVLDPKAGPTSGDPNRLQQVIWNLLSNAIKFTPKGGNVHVLLERVDSHLEIQVIDTGNGIAPEFVPFVFDRFRQADSSTTRQHGGLGLGLSIVKQLVELHGGTIRVMSPGVGKGATFTVRLPLAVLKPDPEPQAPPKDPAAGAAPGLSADMYREACEQLRGKQVLVVDDEPDARAVVQRLLDDCGAVVRTASSVAEAMSLFLIEAPDVVVSDIGMPGEDGYSLIHRIRSLAREHGGHTPALALTAYARPEDRVRAIRAGFQMQVVKPVEPVELITMVASLAGGHDQ